MEQLEATKQELAVVKGRLGDPNKEMGTELMEVREELSTAKEEIAVKVAQVKQYQKQVEAYKQQLEQVLCRHVHVILFYTLVPMLEPSHCMSPAVTNTFEVHAYGVHLPTCTCMCLNYSTIKTIIGTIVAITIHAV